tara:strand:- start:27379 stop:29496 length:2118 start_codon:yes stop_codon:yes gene_type:complete
MAETRPIGEQLRFLSTTTGEHILDDYLEASEKGGRTVPDLLGDIFATADGAFKSDVFQFREDPSDPGMFQVRVGQFINADTGWQTITFTDFHDYVADALSYKNAAELAKTQAESARDDALPVINNITDVLSVASSITDINTVADQLGGAVSHAVTVAGGKFYIDGVQTPAVKLKGGFTYTFDISDSSNTGHPFRFSINANGGPVYTTGVTTTGTAGTSGAQLVIAVTNATPLLYYYCTNHSGMGAAADVRDDNLETLADIDDKITTAANIVAPAISSVITTATDIANINTTSANIADVNIVATDIANVNATGSNIQSVNTVANNANLTAILTAAGHIANIGTVASNINNVNTVVTNIADLQSVAGEIGGSGDINIVAGNIGAVGQVATSITAVNTVATNMAAIQNVSQDLLESISEIDTVAQSITNVDAVGTNITDVTTVANASNLQNIGTVASGISDVNALAAVATKIGTLADIEDGTTATNALTGLHSNLAIITSLGTNITDIVTTSNNISSVIATAAGITNINTVAPHVGATGNITKVGANIDDVAAVSPRLADIQTLVAGTNLANIQTSASNINDITAAAQNISDIATAATYISQIIEAPLFAEDAEKYAVHGVNSTFTDRDGNVNYSAKHWASVAQAVGNAFTTVKGDERTSGDTDDVVANGAADSIQFLGLGGAKVRTDQSNKEVYIDSRSVAMAIALG